MKSSRKLDKTAVNALKAQRKKYACWVRNRSCRADAQRAIHQQNQKQHQQIIPSYYLFRSVVSFGGTISAYTFRGFSSIFFGGSETISGC